MTSTFGKIFKVSTFGESHGDVVGVVIDGCPPNLSFNLEAVQRDLDRRKPGQSSITTARKESDTVEVLSGVFESRTLGSPISLLVWNRDQKSKDYNHIKTSYRPSHADFTYQAKYGIRNWKGGGRASARETIGRVAAGAVAKDILGSWYGTEVIGFVRSIDALSLPSGPWTGGFDGIETNAVRCPDAQLAEKMVALIKEVKKEGDSLGGVVEVVVKNAPVGLGEPVFDKLDADLAKACLSIPACKGFENGTGFDGTKLRGSQHNDAFYMDEGRVRTRTNHSGGVQGGISNGEDIVVRAAFKPTATIMIDQESVNEAGDAVSVEGRGRHDPCVVPRAVPIMEAMVALTLMDHALRQNAYSPR